MYYDVNIVLLWLRFMMHQFVLESVIVTNVHGYNILLVFPQMLINCDVTGSWIFGNLRPRLRREFRRFKHGHVNIVKRQLTNFMDKYVMTRMQTAPLVATNHLHNHKMNTFSQSQFNRLGSFKNRTHIHCVLMTQKDKVYHQGEQEAKLMKY